MTNPYDTAYADGFIAGDRRAVNSVEDEIARLRAELVEAKGLIKRFVDAAWTEPSMSGRKRLMGLAAEKYMAVYPDARAFLDKAKK